MSAIKDIKKFREKNAGMFSLRHEYYFLFVVSLLLAVSSAHLIDYTLVAWALFGFSIVSLCVVARFHRMFTALKSRLREDEEYMYYAILEVMQSDRMLCNHLGRKKCNRFYDKKDPTLEEIYDMCDKIIVYLWKKHEAKKKQG